MAKDENKFNFEKDERVLCYHGPFIYEAKILKKEKRDDEGDGHEINQYFVHYKGWKQTWDEWITEDRVLKYTEANLQKQKQLKEIHSKRKPSRTSSTASIHESTSTGTATELRGRKRIRDSSIEKARLEEENKRPEIKLIIPDSLKSLLVDDWENVTKNRQILSLPKAITVEKILEDYKASCQPMDEEALNEFIMGVQLYFNKSLSTSLLYKIEYDQYEEIFNDDKTKQPSSVYGVEHLLRLFVEIPNMISDSNVDSETLSELKERFEALLSFIQIHEKEYFTNEYSHVK
ncbi:MRG-domain-containing protein [Cokeromyces recurvatus]|uniref:MRG-domain-containing protein n=1 Tax=Cokeromyces recurvatus TaxID=90255 RepID=UPI00221E8AC6|nr:MRG-domain-containing protein [Cokeromyces recurvatus]KAI7902514.1 MRG-domain-containing protein [Cokeromyces recurvatus]